MAGQKKYKLIELRRLKGGNKLEKIINEVRYGETGYLVKQGREEVAKIVPVTGREVVQKTLS